MPKYTRHMTTTRKPAVDTLSIAIIASSMGYRMKSYGPKSLITLPTGETLIENQINNILSIYPKAELILTVGFEADKIIKRRPTNIRIIENQYYDLTNIVEDIRLVINNIYSESLIIINGNIQFNSETVKNLTLKGSAIVINNNNIEDDIGATIIDNQVMILSHGISPKWANIVYFTEKEFKLLKSIVADRDKGKLYLFEIINMILDKGGSFRPYTNEHIKIKQIDSIKDLK